MKKCKYCPYKKHCCNECYGENPCDFAKAFDRMGKKIEKLEKEKGRNDEQPKTLPN